MNSVPDCRASAGAPGSLAEPKLDGLRVLVVEDSFLIATSVSRMLAELGCRVVGPVGTVQEAIPLVESGACDVGVLDINLGPAQTSEPVAGSLTRRRLPFFFITGYASPSVLSAEFKPFPKVHKPVTSLALKSAMLRAILGEN